MGFFLSILYFVTYYLTPTTMFGPLAAAHIEMILAVLVSLVSLPALMRSFILKTPQSLALLGLALAVFLSVLIGMNWPGRALFSILGFIPNAFAYMLVCLHCNSKKKLQVLVAMLLFVCLFVITRGYIDLRHGISDTNTSQAGAVGTGANPAAANATSYVLSMRNDAGDTFYRIRGQGEINDPNDFGQLLVCVLPLPFIFWQTKKTSRNISFVLLPVCILLYGIFLTRSRGALLALVAVVLLAARPNRHDSRTYYRLRSLCGSNGLALHRRTRYFGRIGL